jgi:hypothetical protein
VYLFVVWSEAREQEDRILTDLGSRFRVLDVVEVTWTADETFARSLTRMYGDALPPGSDKELHCGTGPFLAVVVEDPRPRFRVRHTSRGRRLLNAAVFDARHRYRAWTGSGYRVHASDCVAETERNLVLLFGEGVAELAARARSRPPVRRHAGDPVGTSGWDSVEQLRRALGAYGATVLRASDGAGLTAAADDAWWAEHIAGGTPIGEDVREVLVAGEPVRLRITQRPQAPVRAVNAVLERVLRR